MTGSLSNSVALITGGGRGFGRALAKDFAANGAAVAVVARTLEQVQSTALEIEAEGGRALAFAADVTDSAAVEGVVAQVAEHLGRIDVLVNNAAIVAPLGRLWETDPEDWRRNLEVNVVGPMICCRAVLAGMLAAQDGRILNIVSIGASMGGPVGSAYTSSKAALTRFTESLAMETRDLGVSTFAIDPGSLETDMLRMVRADEQINRYAPFTAMLSRASNDAFDKPLLLCRRLASGEASVFTGRFLSYRDDLDELLSRSAAVIRKDGLSLRRQTGK